MNLSSLSNEKLRRMLMETTQKKNNANDLDLHTVKAHYAAKEKALSDELTRRGV